MRRWPVIVTGMFTVVICLVVYLFEPRFLAAVSRQAYDTITKITATAPRSDKVVIVDIDEGSLNRIGHWPWPRYELARLTERLFENGAAVVAYDMLFAERDRFSPAEVEAIWRNAFGAEFTLEGVPDKAWSFDSEFAASMQKGPVVLACYMGQAEGVAVDQDDLVYRGRYYELGSPQRGFLLHATTIVQPVAQLGNAADGLAFINATVDDDNILRRTPLVHLQGRDRIYPSLALEAVRLFLGVKSFGIEYDDKGVAGIKGIDLKDVNVPTDSHGRLVLNYRSEAFPRISAADVLEGTVPEDLIAGRIVLVGASAAGLLDLVATPLAPEVPGIEVQATAIENMLTGDVLKEPRWMPFANMALMIVLGALLTILINRAGALRSAVVTLLAVAGVLCVSLWALREARIVIAPTEIALALVAVYVAVTLVKYRIEERERQRVRTMFGAMVSNEVLQYLEEHPESFSLAGRKCEATAFFSDIAGFMTIAESLDPQRLQQFINRYLTPTTEIIMAHQGLVNRFVGDAVLAAWNVPYALKGHALEACLAALEQQEKIAEIRETFEHDFGHVLRVRMGVNTGMVTVGYMGSERRREYTLLGDTVNLASRFETANRDYGTSIIIGEPTYLRAREHIDTRFLDLVVVRGETKPVRIYELLARKGQVPKDKWDVVRIYEAAIRLHWERRWEDALAKLEVILEMDIKDPPTTMLRQRILNYRDNPPPPNWGGEYIKLTK